MSRLARFLLAILCLGLPLRAALAADPAVSAGAVDSEGAPSSSSSAGGGGLTKKFEENEQITDAELKTRAGSLSRVSMAFNLSYSGPTLSNWSVANQPNPDGTVSATAVGPSGSIGTRYRIDSTQSLTLNVGVTDQYLFTTLPSHIDINNPYVTYDRSFTLGGVQMVASPGVSFITSNVYKPSGEVGSLDARLYSAYAVPNSRFTLGNTFAASYYFFNRAYRPDEVSPLGVLIPHDGRIVRSYALLAPLVKYNLTDKFNLNTSWGFSLFNPRYYDSRVRLNSRLMDEWLGVGYAITRDIYLNPYLQFYPTQFSWRATTMNLSTVFSLM